MSDESQRLVSASRVRIAQTNQLVADVVIRHHKNRVDLLM